MLLSDLRGRRNRRKSGGTKLDPATFFGTQLEENCKINLLSVGLKGKLLRDYYFRATTQIIFQDRGLPMCFSTCKLREYIYGGILSAVANSDLVDF